MNPQVERAEHLIALGRPAEAREILAIVLASEPDNVDALLTSANAALVAEDYTAAIDTARGALRLEPENQYGLRILAISWSDLGEANAAMAIARRAVELGPDTVDNHRIYAHVALQCKRLDVAMPAIDAALALDPDSAACHVIRGNVLAKSKRISASNDAYRRALEIDPERATALNGLAVNDLNSNRLVKATKGLFAAAAVDPSLASNVRQNVSVILHKVIRYAMLAFYVGALLLFLAIGAGASASSDTTPSSSYAGTTITVGEAPQWLSEMPRLGPDGWPVQTPPVVTTSASAKPHIIVLPDVHTPKTTGKSAEFDETLGVPARVAGGFVLLVVFGIVARAAAVMPRNGWSVVRTVLRDDSTFVWPLFFIATIIGLLATAVLTGWTVVAGLLLAWFVIGRVIGYIVRASMS